MNIEYYHKNVDPLGEATKEYIEEKLETLEKLTKVRKMRVEVAQEKNGDFYVEVTVKSSGGFEYRSEEKCRDVNACIDIIEEELKTQIRRDTEKARDLKRRGGRSIKKKMTIDENARF
ncbi:MAG: ribosome-associated translation inhibitor RaiA [Patescibacteria group bacterium]